MRTAVVLSSLALASCSFNNELRGRDSSPLNFTTRIVAPTSRQAADEEGGQAGSERAIELTGDVVVGDFHQDATGIDTDYSMWQVAIGARFGADVGEVLDLDVVGGLQYQSLEFDFVDPLAGFVDQDRDGIGPYGGLELGWTPIDRLSLYGRATMALLIGDFATSGMAEAGVRVDVGSGLHLLGGFRHWRYRHEEDGSSGPVGDIDIAANGFVFGAEIRF